MEFKKYFEIDLQLEFNIIYSLYYLISEIGNCNEYSYFLNLQFNEDFSIKDINDAQDNSLINLSYSINQDKFSESFSSNEISIKNRKRTVFEFGMVLRSVNVKW